MTETRQLFLFLACIIAAVSSFFGVVATIQVLDKVRADNQTVAELRAQVTQLKKDPR